jgi:hypothetical protein
VTIQFAFIYARRVFMWAVGFSELHEMPGESEFPYDSDDSLMKMDEKTMAMTTTAISSSVANG